MDLQSVKWTEKAYNSFLENIKTQSDEKYRKFHSSLVPETEDGYILGIRMPILRNIAKQISNGDPNGFLSVSKGKLYEEKMIRGIVTGLIKPENFSRFTELCDTYVDEIDNWALCDCFCSGLKYIKKYREEFFEYLKKYIESSNVWKIRTALVIMLDYYLDDEYIDRVLDRADSIDNDFYYVNMAQAWLIATAAAKCPERTMKIFLSNNLNKFTFNKAIQKCIESRRIDDRTKNYLRTLRIS